MNNFPKAIGYALVTIIMIVLVVSFILSLLLRFSSLTESSLPWIVITTNVVALFIGGVVAGKKGEESGWITGSLTGLVYALIIFLIQFLGFDLLFDWKQIVTHLGYVVIATMGGMIGVNLKVRS